MARTRFNRKFPQISLPVFQFSYRSRKKEEKQATDPDKIARGLGEGTRALDACILNAVSPSLIFITLSLTLCSRRNRPQYAISPSCLSNAARSKARGAHLIAIDCTSSLGPILRLCPTATCSHSPQQYRSRREEIHSGHGIHHGAICKVASSESRQLGLVSGR
ncbi:uncharacterized protein BDV14DRAFT_171398 [Aspergillus stella-maris]|uniref:uncharacterized protein n=1 Tax=Aspergillus stella-maris TaxID=1810926 RepID=UPI003CCE1D22